LPSIISFGRRQYLYRCGKYGPNTSLIETLRYFIFQMRLIVNIYLFIYLFIYFNFTSSSYRDISKIIPGSLVFESIRHETAVPFPEDDNFLAKLDLNTNLWETIKGMMFRWMNTVNIVEMENQGTSSLSQHRTTTTVASELDSDEDTDNHSTDQNTIASGGTAYSDDDYTSLTPASPRKLEQQNNNNNLKRDRSSTLFSRQTYFSTSDWKRPQDNLSSTNALAQDDWKFDPVKLELLVSYFLN
jgi:hypothetical protein